MKKSFFFQLSFKAVGNEGDNGNVVIEGFASTPDIDRYNDIVEPTAFTAALELYQKNPVVLRSHDMDKPIGRVTSATITDKGLFVRAEIMDEQTKTEIKDGRMNAMSIGYCPLETVFQHKDGKPFDPLKDSLWDEDIVRVIKKLDLVEISIVSTPANGYALFSVAKSVKNFFRELATKSLVLKKSDGEEAGGQQDSEMQENNVDDKKDDTQNLGNEEKAQQCAQCKKMACCTETTDCSTCCEGDVCGTDCCMDAAKKDAEVEKPEKQEAAEEQTTQKQTDETTSDAGASTQEEAEKTGEEPVAGSGEAAKASEEPQAEAKPGEETSEAKKVVGEVNGFIVDAKTASIIPELVEAGIATVDEKATELPAEFVAFTRKMVDQAAAQLKRADDLQAELNSLPTKRALIPAAQFGVDEAKTALNDEEAKKATSDWFKSLFRK